MKLDDWCYKWSRNCPSSGAPEFTPGFFSCFLIVIFYFYTQYRHCNSFTQQDKVHMIRSLVLCVVFCRSFILSLIFWSLCDLSFADLRIRITPLVSSNSSYICYERFGTRYVGFYLNFE